MRGVWELHRKTERFDMYSVEYPSTCQYDLFTVENGLMTPTMKVKRNKVIEKYKNILEKFYLK